MPLGIVSDEDFKSELDSTKVEVEIIKQPGRRPGDIETPQSIRKIIGEEVDRSESLELASLLDISKQSVSAYRNGATSCATYNKPDQDLSTHINRSRERIVKRASNKLNSALSYITQEKLEATKARDLAGIAKDMSAIVKNLEPEKETSNDRPNVNFTVFAPIIRKESSYEVIEAVDMD